MAEIFIPSAKKQTIIVPKSGFTGGRNSLGSLFQDAGYDKFTGEFDRRDQMEQGDVILRGVKGSDAVATQLDLYSGKSIGIIMGTDVLSDALALGQNEYGIQTEIQRLLTLALGPCTLNFLAPEESPIRNVQDLVGRRIFTKYPSVLKEILKILK